MNVGQEIGEAFAQIQVDEEEERQREKYRAAMRVLREIPSGTPDSELTPEQRQAWRDHDEALQFVRSATTREP